MEGTRYIQLGADDRPTVFRPDEVPAGAAELLRSGCTAVLIKGGHAADDGGVAQDYYTDGDVTAWLSCARVQTAHTHGTGCTLSSAIAALLSRGLTTLDAIVLAKAYVTQGLAVAEPLGKGPGPVGHTRWPDDAGSAAWPRSLPPSRCGCCRSPGGPGTRRTRWRCTGGSRAPPPPAATRGSRRCRTSPRWSSSSR